MRLVDVTMRAYGACLDVAVPLGPGVTVVLGENESGKSTALDAVSDLLWGIPARSSRSFVHARGALRIDATVEDAGGRRVVVRRSSGLFADDLVTPIAAPWDPDASGSADWWRTRLGLSLEQLRAGGLEVFAGGGDLGELVFVAREGRSGRLLLQSLMERRDALFKSDRRARSVRVREALAAYDAATALRDASVTRSAAVTDLREQLARAERHLLSARELEAEADRRVRVAEEDARAIPHVLRLRAAQSLLEEVDAQGPRMSGTHLDRLREAQRLAQSARVTEAKLGSRIAEIAAAREALVVDEPVLIDSATLSDLRLEAGEKISAARRAEDEFAPIVRQEQARLVTLLARLGVLVDGDLDGALASVEVTSPLRAELTEAADALVEAEEELVLARRSRDDTLASLVGRGLVIDPEAGSAPRQDRLSLLRAHLARTLAEQHTRAELLTLARSRLDVIRGSGAAPAPIVEIGRQQVVDARAARDAAWQRVREPWVAGHPLPEDVRAAWAEAVDAAVEEADDRADRAAADGALVSAHDARLEAQAAGITSATADVAEAERERASATLEVERAERAWRAAWLDLGVEDAPDVAAAPDLLALVAAAFEQQVRVTVTSRAVDDARVIWQEVTARAGLPGGMAPIGWRERLALLDEIEESRRIRDSAALQEAGLREQWARFVEDVEVLLLRHEARDDALDGDGDLGPAAIHRGLQLLEDRRRAAQEAATARRTANDRMEELRDELDDVRRAIETEEVLRQELAGEYGTDGEEGLEALAQRAEQATGPLASITESRALLVGALDPGSSADEVMTRLLGHDQEAVALAMREALESQAEAGEAAVRALGARSDAMADLRTLESAMSAAEAEAAVAERLSDVVALTEEWSVLSLEVALLEQTLARIGSDDTRPLLDRAGRMLERITGGRYLALRAEETPAGRTLQVVRADGERMAATELSEGTADQVFFALRMSAVAEVHEQRRGSGLPALPIVLDDVLMAFDDARTLDALELLHELADDLQIIVFTHHASVAAAAASIDGITVSPLPPPASIDQPLDGELVRATVQQYAGEMSGVAPAVAGAVARDARDERAAARAWAVKEGIPVGSRGRVPEEIMERYRARRE